MMVRKKIDDELFRILYDEGLSREELATYFDVTLDRISVRKIELRFTERNIPCRDCGRLFETSYLGRFTCNTCKSIRNEQFVLRRFFYRLLKGKPNMARQFESEMISEEGLDFRELALDGLSTYGELKNGEKKKDSKS